MPPTSQAPGTATLIIRLRRYARPGPRCTVRRCTDSVPAVGQSLLSLRVCLRLRARAGRHTVLVLAHDKVPVVPYLHDTCLCSNPDVGTPSSLRSFFLRCAQHRHHRTLPYCTPYERAVGTCTRRNHSLCLRLRLAQLRLAKPFVGYARHN